MKNICLYLFLFAGCSVSVPDYKIDSIDIEDAYAKRGKISLSDISDSIEYVPLETLPQSTLKGYLRVFATDEYIIAVAFRQNYLFDRNTGKFIREIGRYGEGPDEYMATEIYLPFDENKQSIYCYNFKNGVNEYNLEGKLMQTIHFPKEIKLDLRHRASLNEDISISYIKNQTGNALYKIVAYHSNGDVFKTYKNYHSFTAKKNRSPYGDCTFYSRNNSIFFYENCVDTLFIVSEEKLTPYIRLSLGKYNPPYKEKNNLHWPRGKPMLNDFFDFDQINESNRFVFFSYWHQHNPLIKEYYANCHYFGYYDKQSEQTYISDLDQTNHSPILNDIDHFVPVHPMRWSVNKNEEMVAFIEAGDIAEWFEENPEKADKLPARLRELSKLTSEDNPVIVIAKLKQ